MPELAARIDQVDFARINEGLGRAQELLEALPATQRGQKALIDQDYPALLALYEAFCCIPFHSTEAELSEHFDSVLAMLQTKKPLRLGDVLPAMTRFLFQEDNDRRRFAENAWKKMTDDITPESFDWAVQDGLIEAMMKVSVPGTTTFAVMQFWEGAHLIMQRLDQEIITHSIRGMEPNLYLLALHHLAHDSTEVLNLICKVLCTLIETSPNDFWSAFNTISPSTVSEQIFNNPAFARSLERPITNFDSETPPATSWVVPFIQSLPAAQQYDLCRTLLFHLLERMQDSRRVSEKSRLLCCLAGLRALLVTLMSFAAKEYTINASTGRIIVNDLLGLVDKYKGLILSFAALPQDTIEHTDLSKVGMQVVRFALELDCKALNSEYQALQGDQPIQHGLSNHSQSIWQAVLDAFTRDNFEMARSVLIGITPLLGLEKFKPRMKTDALSKDKVMFNGNFGQLSEVVSHVFGRLSDFNPTDLRRLCETSDTAFPLIGALTSAEQTTFEAAVDVIKTVTGEAGRRDAISKMLQESFSSTLSSFSFSVSRISKARTFASVPRLLKTSRDFLDSLCDPAEGILRARSLTDPKDRDALIRWWHSQWVAMMVAFESTEEWSFMNDRDFMTDFCRDAMEYAEALFDQISVVASAFDLGATATPAAGTTQKRLLERPRHTIDALTKWLRLKEPYLLSTVVSLLCKLLRRLGEADMTINEGALMSIRDVSSRQRSNIKTVVTQQQKAELRRALDEHEGLEVVEELTAKAVKQSKIDMWSRSADGVKHEPVRSEASKQRAMIHAQREINALSSAAIGGKSTLDQMRSRHPPTIQAQQPLASGLTIRQQREKEKEEKKKRDAIMIAKAKALREPVRVPGEGSGLKGIGVHGKDHAPLKSEIFHDGDSDSDSDEDDVDVGGAVPIWGRKKDVSSAESEERRALIRRQQELMKGPVKKIKVQRSVKDMRARLSPNMDAMHLTILGWDIFHEGDDPPSGEKCIKVSNAFISPFDYKRTFDPLLLSEAWRSFVTAKEEGNFKTFEIKVVNRMSVDQFVEVSTTMPKADANQLHLGDSDIILLSKGARPLHDKQELHCLARVYRITWKKDVAEISYRVNGRSGLVPTLSPGIKLHGIKITSMTTIEREYAALHSLEYYDLCDEVLNAKPSPILKYSDQVLAGIERNYQVNNGQARAIQSAKENDAFTLIQGYALLALYLVYMLTVSVDLLVQERQRLS